MRIRPIISRFLSDGRGSAMIEYSLIAAAVAIGILSALSSLGETLGGLYQTILSGLVSIGGSGAG